MAVRIKELPSLDLLGELFELADEGSGLRWRVDRRSKKVAGTLAGNIWTDPRTKKQYWVVMVNGKGYKAHRLVYALSTGQLPPVGLQIDHRDGNGLNNSPSNLRLATQSENQRNRKGAQRNSQSGALGVHRCKNGKWVARIMADGVQIFLGCFDSKLRAHLTRIVAQGYYWSPCYGSPVEWPADLASQFGGSLVHTGA